MSSPHAKPERATYELPRRQSAVSFWKYARELEQLTETQRVTKIKSGFKPEFAEVTKSTFDLSTDGIVRLLSMSTSTYGRLRKSGKLLDTTASERLDRVASVARLAEDVFEDEDAAAKWLATPNAALDGSTPLMHCETEIGARQVRRILNALEWGGVV